MKFSFIFYLIGLVAYIFVNMSYTDMSLWTWATYIDFAGVVLSIITSIHFMIFDSKLNKSKKLELYFEDNQN